MLAESSYCGYAVYHRSKIVLFIMGLLLLVIPSRNEVQLVLVPDSLLKHIYMLPVVRESIVHDDMKVQILSLICIENIILD